MAGYHLREIPQGEYGELSKVFEELEECRDALLQANPIMLLVELSDLVGACLGYIGKYSDLDVDDVYAANLITPAAVGATEVFRETEKLRGLHSKVARLYQFSVIFRLVDAFLVNYGLRFADALLMSEATQRAFASGARTPKRAA